MLRPNCFCYNKNGNPTVDGQNLAQVDVTAQGDNDDGRSHQATQVPSLAPELSVEMHSSAEVHLCKISARPRGVVLAARRRSTCARFWRVQGGGSSCERSSAMLNMEWVVGEGVPHFTHRCILKPVQEFVHQLYAKRYSFLSPLILTTLQRGERTWCWCW